MEFMSTQLVQFLEYTGFANVTWGHIAMIIIGLVFIFLGIKYEFEPLLLVPIGFGMLIGNIPFYPGLKIGIYEQGSVLNILYHGVHAMTDFSALLSNPKLMLIGAAAQVGIFAAYMGALALGFMPNEAGAIGIIGGADGPTAIFISSQLAPDLMGAIAVSAYSYMALVPVIQPPIMRLMTTPKERTIRMKPPRQVSKLEKITFPIIGLLFCAFIVPSGLPLLGMLFFGNLLKECGVTKRLSDVASNAVVNICTLLIGITVGASTQASVIMNLFLKEGNKINPLIGNSGVSAVPDAARVSNNVGLEYDKTNYLLQHAMGPNVAGVVGSAVAAGILLAFLH